MKITEHLGTYREDIPQWLRNYRQGDTVAFSDFMSGRIGYYPGSGKDAQLVEIGNRSHCVHSFIQLDYLLTREELSEALRIEGFKGYHVLGTVEWSEKDLFPEGRRRYKAEGNLPRDTFINSDYEPYYSLIIFERDSDRDENWGAERFAVAFFMADGIEMYFQLFSNNGSKHPFLVLLQDHGFGCNYDKFGQGGVLSRIVSRCRFIPEFIICARNTDMWDGYMKMENVEPVIGGMCGHVRYLYRRTYQMQLLRYHKTGERKRH